MSSTVGIAAIRDDEVHVYVMRLQLPPEQLERAAALLLPEERDAAARFLNKEHEDRWIAARSQLRAVLSGYSAARPSDIHFQAGANGKPQLVPAPSVSAPVQFNLTHSNELALLAVTASRPVGVDIEFLQVLPDFDLIVAQHFSPGEQRDFAKIPADEKVRAFYNGWTRKEAIIKATGEGLGADLASFTVSLENTAQPRVIAANGNVYGTGRWQLFNLAPDKSYVGCVAINAAVEMTLAVAHWDTDSLGNTG